MLGKAILILISICYPLIVFLGLTYTSLPVISLGIATIGVIRLLSYFWQKKKAPQQSINNNALLISIIMIALALSAFLLKNGDLMLYYPVLINIILLISFLYTLFYPPTMIERFARLREKNITDNIARYTRKITQIWCLFFCFNGAISFYTIFQGISVWTLYNGLISYICIGILLAGEWCYRQWMIRQS